jgi:hypothetical protein
VAAGDDDPHALRWEDDGFLQTVRLSAAFADRFRDLCAAFPPPSVLTAGEAARLAATAFHATDRARLRDQIAGASADCGGVLVRSGGMLRADELTVLLLAAGSVLGPVLPELGCGGALWRRVTYNPWAVAAGNPTPAAGKAFRLHTDGAYHDPPPDWVALGMVGQWAASGGDTLLLHVADWDDLRSFLADPRANRPALWETPGAVPAAEVARLAAACVATTVSAPLLEPESGGVRIRFGIRLPATDADFFAAVGESLGRSARVRRVALAVGDAYLVNNRYVLHGRDALAPHPAMYRAVVRVRGWFDGGEPGARGRE